jgi:hypothetical protein
MNPRRLDGGSQELASLILRNLQGAFPGVEFSLEPLDQTEFGVYWRYKAPSAPSEKDVRVYMALHWPSIDAKLRDSDGRAFAGRRGEMTDTVSQLAAAPAAIKPPKKSVRICGHCGAELRRSAKLCTTCGWSFPTCVLCGHVLYPEDNFCGGCGLRRCHY